MTTHRGALGALGALGAYYNEFDPHAAQWLRNLIKAGHIAPGDVDERSILDVAPDDLRGYVQCHFFAGVGVWSLALRHAGWADSRPIWTGSCPCQPFSAAGAGRGFDDERHLWPAFHHLIAERRPAVVLGEQVASKAVDPWIDLVHADLEAMGYAFGSVPFPSAGVGAPHIRDRNYWVANANHAGLEGRGGVRKRAAQLVAGPGRMVGGLGHAESSKRPNGMGLNGSTRQHVGDGTRSASRVCSGDDSSGIREMPTGDTGAQRIQLELERPGPTNGFWRDADWLGCRDGKWRAVEPGTFPLVDGTAGRVGRVRADWHTPAGKEGQGHRAGRLRGYGNAINAEAARIWIETVMECMP